jgi:hypothetical protein
MTSIRNEGPIPTSSSSTSATRDLKKLQKKAWNAGWWPAKKKNGILWLAPGGSGHVMLHGSSSDHHAYDNALAEFRNAGLKA